MTNDNTQPSKRAARPRPDSEYLLANLFDGDDAEIRCYQKKIIKTRTAHRCAFAAALYKPHQIQPGTRALIEKGIVDGAWGAAYSCLDCIDLWLRSVEVEHG